MARRRIPFPDLAESPAFITPQVYIPTLLTKDVGKDARLLLSSRALREAVPQGARH